MGSAGAEEAQAPEAAAPQMIVIVTGMSGAGRTTAIHALEDLGFEGLNNFPLALVERLVKPGDGGRRPIAIGVESRTRGFSARALTELVARLRGRPGIGAMLLFLDCPDETLIARFSQTRRRHPLAPGEDVATGIARERDILAEVRARADAVIDTSELTPHALKAEVALRFPPRLGTGLVVGVHSFSYKRGAPLEADMVLDCRFLRNPYWDEALRGLDGRDPAIQGFVRDDPLFRDFFEKVSELVLMLLPAYKAEGKAYFCVALGCTGGRHRSVAIGELLSGRLHDHGWPVILRHREMERAGAARDGSGA